jgi:hypothetical protein
MDAAVAAARASGREVGRTVQRRSFRGCDQAAQRGDEADGRYAPAAYRQAVMPAHPAVEIAGGAARPGDAGRGPRFNLDLDAMSILT